MKTVRDLAALREAVGGARREARRVGFIPTMGALHDGHLSLVRRAKSECGFVVVSIFVNPLQFAAGEDFDRYPRRLEVDAAVLESAGADLLYAPVPANFYPPGFSTSVDVADVSDGGEGAARPGHFRGVATVVAKLFLQVGPDAAYFGRKDLQQTAVIRRMVRDLDFPLRVVIAETVREADGLAMSSRNVYLSGEQRTRAAALSRALFHARDRAAAGQTDPRALEDETRRELEAAGLSVDYVEAIEAGSMARADRASPGIALAAAVRVGKTRLLDNVVLEERKTP
ncbi:MAG: pantoate--beta-alanine ligase [Acidobacteria bacterium]|nr:pantoate--beta-alanine ligase [Acidobacteriota bacterium]MCA1611057.1 pantoate--beta-alanine ligase [Acidobacteriota bacterium]